ncbi:hypothetical protein RA263_27875, partial [Pseudomonas syringae pv. tagetis]|uniref:hypothetical protein n=1 Tax=Pseudomonas syringae group genomosp. 7 TaxID=251699 RepID=UPI00376FD56F
LFVVLDLGVLLLIEFSALVFVVMIFGGGFRRVGVVFGLVIFCRQLAARLVGVTNVPSCARKSLYEEPCNLLFGPHLKVKRLRATAVCNLTGVNHFLVLQVWG